LSHSWSPYDLILGFFKRTVMDRDHPSTINKRRSAMTRSTVSQAQDKSATVSLELIQMRLISEAICVVASLGIADLLGAAPMTSDQLAQATGANPQSLYRVMRALQRFGVFSNDSADRFTLTVMGQHLRRDADGSLYPAAMLFGGADGARMLELFSQCVKLRSGFW
jgi:hypothetical protein